MGVIPLPGVAPLQGPAVGPVQRLVPSVRGMRRTGSFYLMPPAKPWMNFFCAKR